MQAVVFAAGLLLVASSAEAKGVSFAGEWEVDLRTPAQKSARAECGRAGFKLTQAGDQIVGDHWMATANCERVNDGGEGTVVGEIRRGVAILKVTSGRNGQVVRGRATREGASLRWQVLEELKAGESEGDSGLILNKGLLRRKAGSRS